MRLGHVHVASQGQLVDFRDDDALTMAVRGIGAPLNGIVLAHGMLGGGLLGQVSPRDWRAMLDANLTSIFTILHAADSLLAPGASIVLISSTAALDRSPTGGPQYTASKWGVNGLVRHLCVEFGARGIRINSVCPGTVNTAMARMFADAEVAEIKRMPLGRMAEPEEISSVVSFLLSPGAGYITGANISVSGGYK
jgi:NAD(P)-dependent dehydrogenase (short-subunit alcohol dehydrogenase family)